MSNDLTTIPIFKKTRQKLKAAKRYKRESYDEQINRLLLLEEVNQHGQKKEK